MWMRNRIAYWTLALAVCVFLTQPAVGRIIYVDADAPGANNGSSWADACKCLQDALADARSDDEIRVAQGIHKADQYIATGRSRRVVGSGDQAATFQLKNGVSLKGGYAGYGEADPDARDVEDFETVLSGDLNGDDVPVKDIHNLTDEPTRAENTYHVVTASHTNDTAVLDGFTITGGNANSGISEGSHIGGGIYNTGVLTITNCRLRENTAGFGGGGIWSGDASLTLANCTLSRNCSSRSGGAINNVKNRLVATDCTFFGNVAGSGGNGGAIYNENSQVTITNCTFNGNEASRCGGGILNGKYGNMIFTNCVFAGNTLELYNGGAICNRDMSSLILVNCTLARNSAAGVGGGVFSNNCDLTITNSILWGNTCGSGVNAVSQISSSGKQPAVDYCCIEGWSRGLGGTGNHGLDPLLVDADGPDNVPGTQDDDVHLLPGSPCVDTGNNAAVPRFVSSDIEGNPRIINGTVDIGAYEGTRNAFVLSTEALTVPEGATATFAVALAIDPGRPVEVTIAVESGDSDISVKFGDLLIFDSYDYWKPQSVMLVAATDTDHLHGSTLIRISAQGFAATGVTATELDSQRPTVLYVDDSAKGANNGTSWVDAFVDLQSALLVATGTRDVVEIRVAQGIYLPDRGAGNQKGDRKATFQLVNGVAIKGGYAGMGEPDPDAREIRKYRTILSGDLDKNDSIGRLPQQFLNRNDNSYHVVTSHGANAATVLDGFTVAGGNADDTVLLVDDSGAGMYNLYGSPTVSNCTFHGNCAVGESSRGGGMYNLSSSSTIINCVFIGNSAHSGAAMANSSYPWNSHKPTLINCTFTENYAGSSGTIVNSSSNLTLINCTIVGNSAIDIGGGLFNRFDGLTLIINSIIWGNSNRQGTVESSQICGSGFTVHYSCIQEWTGVLGGVGNIRDDPLFIDVVGDLDRHLRLRAGSPCIDAGANEPYADVNAFGLQPVVGVDIDFNVRRFDDPATIDTGHDASPIVDMGAYEYGSPPIPSILYVNDDADGANTGTSWTDASTDLQMALQTAFIASERVRQIWAAVGTYTPAPAGGDRTAAFGLINGLEIYGGFRGGETEREERDPVGNVTILSGDLNRDDFSGSNTGNDNSHHVLVAGGTDSTAVLDGFTVSSGNANLPDGVNNRGGGLYVVSGSPWIRQCGFVRNSAVSGGAVYCERSSATFTDCMFAGNTATQYGGGIYCYLSTPTLDVCTVKGNMHDGAWIENSTIQIVGSNNIAANAWTARESILEGDGTLQIESDVSLEFEDSRMRCNVIGPGALLVGLGSELTIESEAEIDLGHKSESSGRIICNGLLRVKDDAIISNAQVNVTRASFEDNAILANCIIEAEAGTPYGQFFIEDNVQIWLDRIKADGDRYLDLDPSEFDCNNVHVDAIDVRITEGIGGTYGGLFEARGRELETVICPPGKFFCQIDVVPDFGPNTWTLNHLQLAPGAKVNLTNRFDFQAPYDWGGHEEVLYVREVILGPGSVLNTAFNRLYYETLIMDPTAKIVNVPLLGFSLNNISFDDENEFLTRVKHNNLEHPENPVLDRIHVERVEGLSPDPNGMMRMCNLTDNDPKSPTYGHVVEARTKGLFAKSREDVILIHFEYLFETSDPDVVLVVYLTDAPELLNHGDPDRANHYVKVARLSPPPVGRPGSAGSGRFGVFKAYVKCDNLDFVRGTRLEFELIGPAGNCVLINNWDPQVHCSDLYCGDVTGDHGATVLDYLTVIANVGSPAGLLPDGTSTACLEFGFGVDGRIDTLDVSAWAWMLSREELPNLCDIFLTPSMSISDAHVNTLDTAKNLRLQSSLPTAYPLDALLITGKSGKSDDSFKLEDSLYVLDAEGQYICKFNLESNCTNGRLVRDGAGEIYQVNHEKGLLRLSDGVCIIPPAIFTVDIEPRNGSNAQISIGLHSEYISYDDELVAVWVGRPILDAAFDAEGYVYITPVVVNPDGNEPYEAVARLQLLSEENPSYRIVQLYDDPPPPSDNRDQDNLREIEVSDSGNLYVINTGNLNESDILWVYDIDTGQVKDRAELGNPYSDCFLPAPVAMHISNTRDMLYMASSQNDPNSICTSVYAFSEGDLSFVAATDVNGMGHITDITDDPMTDTLWIIGFTMLEIPDYIDSNVEPFYTPYLARIPYENNEAVEAVCLYDPVSFSDNDLALPLSIVWTTVENNEAGFAGYVANQR